MFSPGDLGTASSYSGGGHFDLPFLLKQSWENVCNSRKIRRALQRFRSSGKSQAIFYKIRERVNERKLKAKDGEGYQ
jgi:hypothetical protein